MIVPTVIATIVFGTQYECMDKLYTGVENKPAKSTHKYIDSSTAMISLDGASAVLKCEDGKYTAHIMTGIRLSDFPL